MRARSWILACSRGAASYDRNNWHEPYVTKARDFSEVDDCDVAMLGGSLTMCVLWGELFPDALVVNSSIGGDVSEGVLCRLTPSSTSNQSGSASG